ncbi:hypothetical protein BpHYR1_045709 [Brachionus plicatilis]|uniref:Uncharacterized protein n=1 Tax=Brachionus plicatilis TaxID=10195 RepID=A0A3M7PSA4_BRAPC|nr:hypothetical protein BpHYR1_045709 [Brachionus plicatilis]
MASSLRGMVTSGWFGLGGAGRDVSWLDVCDCLLSASAYDAIEVCVLGVAVGANESLLGASTASMSLDICGLTLRLSLSSLGSGSGPECNSGSTSRGLLMSAFEVQRLNQDASRVSSRPFCAMAVTIGPLIAVTTHGSMSYLCCFLDQIFFPLVLSKRTKLPSTKL